tara:strand:+ start:474 stop:1025 length:552 start_codon:yes stop_codon:yes gene_type:complete
MKIYGKYIYLRSLSISDALFTYNLRKNRLNSFYLHKPPKSIKDQKNWIKKNIKNKQNFDFIIFDRKKSKKIGTIALNNITKYQAEWGRWISKGNTIQNIEPILLLLNYGFKNLKLKRIYSLTNTNNKKVVNFHKNTPAIYNGIIKSFFLIKNKKADAVKYTFTKKRLTVLKKKFDLMTQLIQL